MSMFSACAPSRAAVACAGLHMLTSALAGPETAEAERHVDALGECHVDALGECHVDALGERHVDALGRKPLTPLHPGSPPPWAGAPSQPPPPLPRVNSKSMLCAASGLAAAPGMIRGEQQT